MAEIPLRARDGSVCAYAIVDDADYDWLNQWSWCLDPEGYARRSVRMVDDRQRRFAMHRQILGLEHGDRRHGEHENRNRLDCRRSNLRIAVRRDADNKQNLGLQANNTSGYRGVHRHKKTWQAKVKLKYKTHYLGSFADELDAARAAESFRRTHMPFAVLDLTLDPVPACSCRMCRS